MWDKLIRKHENIVLVISGHDPCDKIVMAQGKGDGGNTVTQLLIDPQSLDNSTTENYGMVAMLYFSEDGSKVSVEYISTTKSTEDSDYLYKADVNSFDFELGSEKVNSIVSIEKISSEGLVDTYRILFTDGSYFDYTVTNGAAGAAGAAGANGTTPHIGENGNWFIGDTDTGVKAEGKDGDAGSGSALTVVSVEKSATNGLVDTYTITFSDNSTATFTVTNGADGADGKDGADGVDGEDGKDGENGYTPYIGVNGNWIVGGIDTGIPAKGE